MKINPEPILPSVALSVSANSARGIALGVHTIVSVGTTLITNVGNNTTEQVIIPGQTQITVAQNKNYVFNEIVNSLTIIQNGVETVITESDSKVFFVNTEKDDTLEIIVSYSPVKKDLPPILP